MLTLFLIVAAVLGWRAACAALASFRELPRSNEDMVLF
jgi:hypothetical protein